MSYQSESERRGLKLMNGRFEAGRVAARVLAPVIHAAETVLVLTGTLAGVFLVGRYTSFDSFTTFRYYGDVSAVMLMLVIGGMVFGAFGYVILRLERLRVPLVRDHLRHCVLLYVILALLGKSLVDGYGINYGPNAVGAPSGAYFTQIVFFAIVTYGIFADALMLWIFKYRSTFNRIRSAV